MPDFFATCPRGLEKILSDELAGFGATDVRTTDGGVGFAGDWPTDLGTIGAFPDVTYFTCKTRISRCQSRHHAGPRKSSTLSFSTRATTLPVAAALKAVPHARLCQEVERPRGVGLELAPDLRQIDA